MAADRNQGWREAALTGLVERHRTTLVRMCCLCLGDASLAEDAAQETFLKAYRALDSFRGECDEKTWLMRIAINTCKDVRRSAWFPLDKACGPARDAGDASRGVGAV